MVFEDEGHGFTKYSNLVKALKKPQKSELNFDYYVLLLLLKKSVILICSLIFL